MTSGLANAQTPVIPTKGTAATGSGGTSTVAFFGDLKKFACTTLSATCKVDPYSGALYEVKATDYDDDPAGNPGSSTFYVSPNLDDNPLQHAWKFVFIDFNGTNDVQEIQKTLNWCAPGAIGAAGVADTPLTVTPGNPTAVPATPDVPDCRTVWHERVDTSTQALRDAQILTGVNCSNFLGLSTAENQPAHGLITTAQITGVLLNEYRSECIQATMGLHPNNFTISKHLPPGPYQQCVTLHYTSGGQAAPVCKTIIVNAVNGFKVDFTQVTWPSLVKDAESKAGGDWIFNPPSDGFPSIEGTGNTSLVLSGVFSQLVNNNGTPTNPGDDKFITSEFDVQINRRGPTGPPFTLAEYEKISGILAGATWILDGPSTPIPPRLTSGAVCLEPNEVLKLDFSVTPRQPVAAGTYSGTVTLSAAPSSASPPVCAPSLDTGESSTGDANPYDNNPSQTPP